MSDQPISVTSALPPEWVELPLGELAILIRGVTFPKAKVSPQPRPGYLPVLRANNIGADGLRLDKNLVYVPATYINAEQILQPGDLVVGMSSGSRNLVGKAAGLAGAWLGACGAFCAIVRCQPSLNPQFVAYFFRSARYRYFINARLAGININNLRYTDLARLPVPVPPEQEQRRLVASLDPYFNRLTVGVAALRRIQKKLQRYRLAVIQAAVVGDLVPQNPADEPASLLLERVWGEGKSQALPTSPLPSGWAWASLATISDALAGYAFKSKDYTSEGFQIIKIGNVERGKLNLAAKPTFINEVEEKIKEKYLLKQDDILITLTGTRRQRDYGFVALIQKEAGLLLNQRVARLRFQPPLNPHFFGLALQGDYFQNRFFQYETGNVGQGNVGMAALIREAVPVPPLAEQARIVAEVQRRLAAAERLEIVVAINLERAKKLEQAILERAFCRNLIPDNPPSLPYT